MTQKQFIEEFESLINKAKLDNERSEYFKRGIDTPCYILAKYLSDCLNSFKNANISEDKWISRHCEPVNNEI